MQESIRYLDGRHHAQDIVDYATGAYWACCAEIGRSDPYYAEFLRGKVHESFAKLAAELGYRVEKIELRPDPVEYELYGADA